MSVQGWNEPGFSRGYDWTKPDIFQDAVRALERACFDLVILEDSSAVPYAYQGSMDYYLKNAAMTPKFDPVVLTSLLFSVTRHIGIAPTMTTTFYPPWLLARTLSTMDHYSSGRAGFNVVTSSQDASAQNYGYDTLFEHDLRYDKADEYLDLVGQLWDAWEPDAVVMDEAAGVFIDPAKVKAINFAGKHYKSRGPLNVPRSPQGRPLYVIPGGSPRGRKFSGRNAEVVLAVAANAEEMKDYRDDVRRHAIAYGRDPSKVKTLFLCAPAVTRDKKEADETVAAMAAMKGRRAERQMAGMSFVSNIDFSKFDLDQPVGEIKTEGMQTMMKMFAQHGPKASLRQILLATYDIPPIIGTADHIAGYMRETMEEVGGDGFLIAGHFKPKYIAAIVDELVPALQKRQLTRTAYSHKLLRDNMMAF